MKKFVCEEHGEFNTDSYGYSFPASAKCPGCKRWCNEKDFKGINVLSAVDAKNKRLGYKV